MKFRGHETFFIRKGWLGKGLKNVADKADVFVTKEVNPMDILGIGSNMVKSLRYWMQAAGLATEPRSGKRVQTLTDLGRIIYQQDPYLEELGTLLLLQYELATNIELATSWYFFFQEFNMQEFTKDDFVRALSNYVVLNAPESASSDRSITDDFNCIASTYIPRNKSNPGKISPENNIDCPLGELGLIDIANKEKKVYKKSIPAAKIFHPFIVQAMILRGMDQQKNVSDKSQQLEIEINSLLHGKNSIGKVFNLDTITLLDVLRNAEHRKVLKIIRTAGLDVVQLDACCPAIECVRKYYQDLNYLDREEA